LKPNLRCQIDVPAAAATLREWTSIGVFPVRTHLRQWCCLRGAHANLRSRRVARRIRRHGATNGRFRPSGHGKDNAGRLTVGGTDLAVLAREIANPAPVGAVHEESAHNRMRGIVTRTVKDTVMAQIEMQTGPSRIVSLMSREAVDELALDVGVVAVTSIKSTHVVIGVPS
jgi:molybdopterin-binding protein